MTQRRDERDTRSRPEEERSEETRPERTRIPLHDQRDIMSAGTKEGYVRRWVNEVDRLGGNRISQFILAGWAPVTDNLSVGAEAVIEHNDSLGDIVSKHVGGGRKAILMEIRQEYYDEDQAVKQELNDRREASIHREDNDPRFYNKSEVRVTKSAFKQK